MGKVLAPKVTKNTFDETIGEQDSYSQTFSLWVGSGSDLSPSKFVIQWVDIEHVCRFVRHGCKQFTQQRSQLIGLISIPDWLAPVEEGMCFKIQGE